LAGTKRILIIQTAFLGDLLLSVPLFKYLKSRFPECEISLVCRKGFGSLLRDLRLVDRLFEIQKKNKSSYQVALQGVSETEFDLLLCPHESMTSALFARKVKAKKKIGFRKWWNALFFSERVQKDLRLPDSLRQMSLLQNCDPILKKQIQEFQKQDVEWKKKNSLWLTPVPDWASPKVSNLPVSLERFQLGGKFICLFPGSVWKTKQWTAEGFIETGRSLAEQGFEILVMGGPGEEALTSQVSQQIPGSMDLGGKTSLQESLAILTKAQLVITNDSASQHLAALVQTPTVAIFGPTILEFGFRPWNSKSSIVERQGLACRPCGKHGHQKCPLGTHECMKGIQAKEVLQRVEQVLKVP
jgi:heptosyltransferase-2